MADQEIYRHVNTMAMLCAWWHGVMFPVFQSTELLYAESCYYVDDVWLQTGKPLWCATNHLRQLSLPSG